MGIYTQYENTWIDEQIESQLQLITDVILENIAGVRSIVLVGGFGRGEGSVEITQDGQVTCLRDFDIAVIVDRIPREGTRRKLHDQIYESLGLRNPEEELFRHSNFAVDFWFLRKKDLIYPDIWFYDLKTSGQLLYGEDIRNLLPWGKKDIPLSSGLRLLFEKVCGLLGNFSYNYLDGMKIPEQNKKWLIFDCYRTFTDICTALCILIGKYEPKFSDRAKTFKKVYHNELRDLAEVLPDLPKKVSLYTNRKIRPNSTKILNEDPIELWFLTRNYLGTTLSFYLKRYLGNPLLDWKDLPDHTKILASQYYKRFLDSLLHAKLSFTNEVILNITNILYQIITNIEYSYVVTKNTGNLYLRPLLKFYASPSLKFFSAGILTLVSINKDGTIERNCFEKAINELRHCIPVNVSEFNASNWEVLRKHFLTAYKLYSGFHFVK